LSQRTRKILTIVGGVLLIGLLYLYLSLYGVPFKKNMKAKDVQKYLEEKYDEDVELVGAVYNFQNKHYGGVYEIGDVEFYAEEVVKDEEYIDTYPNEIWKREIVTDYKEVYKDVFERAIRIQADFVEYEEPVIEGPEVPRYDEVNSQLSLDLTIDEALSDEHWDGIAEIANSVQERSPHIHSTFLFLEEAEDRETLVTCPTHSEQEIATTEDARTYCEAEVFTGDERND